MKGEKKLEDPFNRILPPSKSSIHEGVLFAGDGTFLHPSLKEWGRSHLLEKNFDVGKIVCIVMDGRMWVHLLLSKSGRVFRNRRFNCPGIVEVLITPERESQPSRRIQKICAGASHFLLLDFEGKIYSFNTQMNEYGQLGVRDTESHGKPQLVLFNGSSEYRMTDISAHYVNSFSLSSTGSLWGWGRNNHVFGITIDPNDPGKAITSPFEMIPGGVSGFIFQGVSCGNFFFRTADGQIGCFGWNGHKQLGAGNKINIKTPLLRREISGIPSSEVLSISANHSASFILTKTGDVYSSGGLESSNGFLEPSSEFQKVPFGSPISQISSGDGRTFFLSYEGDVFYCSHSVWSFLPKEIKRTRLPGTSIYKLDDLCIPGLAKKEVDNIDLYPKILAGHNPSLSLMLAEERPSLFVLSFSKYFPF